MKTWISYIILSANPVLISADFLFGQHRSQVSAKPSRPAADFVRSTAETATGVPMYFPDFNHELDAYI